MNFYSNRRWKILTINLFLILNACNNTTYEYESTFFLIHLIEYWLLISWLSKKSNLALSCYSCTLLQECFLSLHIPKWYFQHEAFTLMTWSFSLLGYSIFSTLIDKVPRPNSKVPSICFLMSTVKLSVAIFTSISNYPNAWPELLDENNGR